MLDFDERKLVRFGYSLSAGMFLTGLALDSFLTEESLYRAFIAPAALFGLASAVSTFLLTPRN